MYRLFFYMNTTTIKEIRTWAYYSAKYRYSGEHSTSTLVQARTHTIRSYIAVLYQSVRDCHLTLASASNQIKAQLKLTEVIDFTLFYLSTGWIRCVTEVKPRTKQWWNRNFLVRVGLRFTGFLLIVRMRNYWQYQGFIFHRFTLQRMLN